MDGCGCKIGPFDCCTIVVADCLDVMGNLPDGCVDLLFADPPYNKGKAEWDRGHDWRSWIPESVRVLAANGAFWAIHRDARQLAQISESIEQEGGPPFVNWIIWDLFNGATAQAGYLEGFTVVEALRSFQQMAEYLIYHADDGQWQSQCDKTRGFIFEPLRAYLDGERRGAGVASQEIHEAWCEKQQSKGRMVGHWFGRSQWMLPTSENYKWLRLQLNKNGGGKYLRREYEDLRREYEDLRCEYEDLRPTFNNPGGISSVWQGPIARRNAHPTPKPLWLLERIIETTSNPGDLVFDLFMGSGTTAVAAQKLGRHFFGCDLCEEYVEMAKKRLSTLQLSMEL